MSAHYVKSATDRNSQVLEIQYVAKSIRLGPCRVTNQKLRLGDLHLLIGYSART
jgi:hypothetical protein